MPRRPPVFLTTFMFVATIGLYIVYFHQSLTVPINVDTEHGQDYDVLKQIPTNVLLKLNDTLPIHNTTRVDIHRLIYTYRDLEMQLCSSVLDWEIRMDHQPIKGQCPQKGIVTVISGGRTGNLLWEYFSVWTAARLTGLDPYVPTCIRKTVDKIFENPTIPTFQKIADCSMENFTSVGSIKEWTPGSNQNIILPRYSNLIWLAAPHRDDIIKEFNLTKKLRDTAQKILKKLLQGRLHNTYTFVAVHVRRTDYIPYIKKKYGVDPVKPQFFINAMNYYRAKYHNCLFVYVSDEPEWCFEYFGTMEDVVIASTKDPILDLAVMGACNHTIFDYGTYGEWGSLLAGGEAVMQNYVRQRSWKNWITISQEPPN